MSTTETWKEIPGFVGMYSVSSEGRVRNRNGVMKSFVTSNGYRAVGLYRNGVQRNFRIHRLVLLAFVGECPVGHEAAHLNGDTACNSLLNLEWATPTENAAHKRKHGTMCVGAANGAAKLNPESVQRIRALRDLGHSERSIADQVDLAPSTVHAILSGQTWRHVE